MNKISTQLLKIAKSLIARKKYFIEVTVHETLSSSTEDDILAIAIASARDSKVDDIYDHGSWFVVTITSNDLMGLQEAVSDLSRYYSVTKVMDN